MSLTLLSLVALLRGGWVAAEDTPVVLATVDEKAITLQDFAAQYPELVSWFGSGAKMEAVQTSLEQMIVRQLLAHEARQSGLATQPRLQAQIDEILAQGYVRARFPNVPTGVEEAESQGYYAQHRERFRLPRMVRIAHILVASQEEAQALRQALQDPAAFETVARERSLDPASVSQGGDLGLLLLTALDPRLAEAALALEPGQISGVIKTDFGYHLVKLIEKPSPAYQPYAEVQQQIQQELVAAKQDALLYALQQEMWAKYRVDMHRAALQAAVQGTPPQETGRAEASPAAAAPPHQHPAKPGPAPHLRLLSTVHSLGALPAEPMTYTFLAMNSGDAELVIRRVHSTCRCARATISQARLLPGQTAQVTVRFDPNYFKEDGRVLKTVYLESNDPEEPRKMIHLAAEIVRDKMANEAP